jgi:hypothetical protein
MKGVGPFTPPIQIGYIYQVVCQKYFLPLNFQEADHLFRYTRGRWKGLPRTFEIIQDIHLGEGLGYSLGVNRDEQGTECRAHGSRSVVSRSKIRWR